MSYGQLGYLIMNLKAIIQFLNEVDGSILMKEGKLRIKKLAHY
jgi:hypothetical protein